MGADADSKKNHKGQVAGLDPDLPFPQALQSEHRKVGSGEDVATAVRLGEQSRS